MKTADAREAMYQHFVDQWADAHTYYFGNESIDPSDNLFVRMSVNFDDRDQVSLGKVGARKFDTYGRVFIQIMGKPGEGMAAIDDAVDLALPIFDSIRIGGTTIRFDAAKSREIGLTEGDRYFAKLVEAPFTIEAQA